MKFQNLLGNYSSFGFNQKMNLYSFDIFDSREDLKKNIPTQFNKVHGVYVFEHMDDGVIYVGSSGKVPNNSKSQGVRNRILHGYTPYKINDQVISYRLKDFSIIKKQEYELSNISIHVIELDKSSKPISIPSVLEHLLLQIFYNSKKKLPIINRVI